jgi:uncharacterized protein
MTSPLKRVVLAGGTGLVGRHLAEAFRARGVRVDLVTRRPGIFPGAVAWEALPLVLDGADAVINLAGEGLADQGWSQARKAALLNSREGTTTRIVQAMKRLERPPQVLVNASAVGFYGNPGAAPLDEGATPGQGFLAQVCQRWEAAADTAQPEARVVKLRLGVVLAREGGALPRMALPVRAFLGAPLGGGAQGVSWIHIEDLTSLIVEVAEKEAYFGPVNATAPCPVSNREFTRALARRLGRPLLPLPGFLTRAALELLFGEMAREVLLGGAFVLPRAATERGFRFRFERVEEALADLLPGRG